MKVKVHEWERAWNKTHTKYKDVFDDAGIRYLNISLGVAVFRSNPRPTFIDFSRVFIKKLTDLVIDDECISFSGWSKMYKRVPAVFCRFKCYFVEEKVENKIEKKEDNYVTWTRVS